MHASSPKSHANCQPLRTNCMPSDMPRKSPQTSVTSTLRYAHAQHNTHVSQPFLAPSPRPVSTHAHPAQRCCSSSLRGHGVNARRRHGIDRKRKRMESPVGLVLLLPLPRTGRRNACSAYPFLNGQGRVAQSAHFYRLRWQCVKSSAPPAPHAGSVSICLLPMPRAPQAGTPNMSYRSLQARLPNIGLR